MDVIQILYFLEKDNSKVRSIIVDNSEGKSEYLESQSNIMSSNRQVVIMGDSSYSHIDCMNT